MDQNIIKSAGQLKNFVEKHDLQDNRSDIRFKALVTIITATSEIEKEEMAVMVNFSVFDRTGKLTLLENDLDPYSYPTVFYPDFAKFAHVDNTYLLIEDIHTRNEKIGKYQVEIYPI